MTYVIVDPGSCHDGDKNKAKELIKIAESSGADAIKFQLLTDREVQGGNTLLPWEWLLELKAVNNIHIFASAFDKKGVEFLVDNGMVVKFAFPSWQLYIDNYLSSKFKAVVSCDPLMKYAYCNEHHKYLYCISEYPVPYQVNFDGIFPNFNGFSSHCMGIEQEKKAVEAGAEILEFHIKGTWDSPCPDATFAKSPQQTEQLIKAIK